VIQQKDIEDFLKLPDWKKQELRVWGKYTNYPLMTKEQEENRTLRIFQVIMHFGDITMEDIEQSPFITFDNMWPHAFDLFLTPRLLDSFDMNIMLAFSYCLFCRYYEGYRKESLKLSSTASMKVMPISGYCIKAIPAYGRTRSSMINPHSKCIRWEPTEFFKQVLMHRILTEVEKTGYSQEEFLADRKKVNFWDFFFSSPSK
jgi:hypothetical protein